MNHISIEGMDGVGKSTTCKLLSERLGYKFVEKPLHYLFDESEDKFDEYIRIRDQVNANPNRVFTSWFYGLGSIYMYEMFKDENIVTDRHFASNYAWSGSDNNGEVYDLLIQKLGKPKLTVILYSPSETIVNRLISRDVNDSDIAKAKKSENIYRRMIDFCKTRELPYLIIDTSNLKPEEVVDEVLDLFDSIYDMREQKYKADIVNHPTDLSYWIDFINPTELFDISVDAIGSRIYSYQQDKIKKLLIEEASLEDIFSPTNYKPNSWENYRSLFYTTYDKKEYDSIRI